MRYLLLAALLVAMTGCGSDTKPEEQPAAPVKEAQSPASAEMAMTLKGHTGEVHSVSFSPDGTRIASGDSEALYEIGRHPGEIKLWDASTGEELHTIKGHTDRVSSVSFSPDGKRIASGSRDKTLRLCDVAP